MSERTSKLVIPPIAPGVYGNYRVTSRPAPEGYVYAFDLVGDDRAASTEFAQLIPISWVEGLTKKSE